MLWSNKTEDLESGTHIFSGTYYVCDWKLSKSLSPKGKIHATIQKVESR